MVDETEKKIHARFLYAVGATIAAFAYMIIINKSDDAAAFMFLMTVALGFNSSKAAEHLYKDAGSSKSKTRLMYAVGGTIMTFAYLFFVVSPKTSEAFMFLGSLASGLGLSKLAENVQFTKKVNQ